MKLTARPLTRRRDGGVGVVVVRAGHPIAAGEWGVKPIREVPKIAALYAADDEAMMRLVRARRARARVWKQTIVGWEIDGRSVKSSRGILAKLSARDALQELVRWAGWIRRWGGSIGSMAGSAWSLWRASLAVEVVCFTPREIPWAEVATGGRQELGVPRGHYEDVERWDISAAYPFAQTELVFPRGYELRTGSVPLDLIGFAHARVRLPHRSEVPFGPLPIRTPGGTLFPVIGHRDDPDPITGWWSISELAMAADFGAEVEIEAAWIGQGSLRLFTSRWWDAVCDGRSMDGPAGTMAKLSTSSLWGGFAVSGSAVWLSMDEAGRYVLTPDRRVVYPPAPSISALVAARVRERLYREALTAVPVLSAHTDGVITPAGYHLHPNTGGPGRWRLRDRGVWVDLVSPQVYRYQDADTRKIVHVVAGTPAELAPRVFRTLSAYLTGEAGAGAASPASRGRSGRSLAATGPTVG